MADTNTLISIRSRLLSLKRNVGDTFSNISPFNPMSRIKLQVELPKMQQEFRNISRQVMLLNAPTFGSQDVSIWHDIHELLEELEDDLF